MSIKNKKIIILLSDTGIFFASLSFIISLRYPNNFYANFNLHLIPFSILLPIWLLVFYISGLYEPKVLKNTTGFLQTIIGALIINTLLSVSFFYLTPFFGITPRANLLLFLITFFVLEVLWRGSFNSLLYRQIKNHILLIGQSISTQKIKQLITENPQLGFNIIAHIDSNNILENTDKIEGLIKTKKIQIIIIPQEHKGSLLKIKSIYNKLYFNLEILSTEKFFEATFQKVPLAEINELWFLDYATQNKKNYLLIKRLCEIFLASFLLIILSPLFLLISVAIKLNSKGNIIYKQIRIGKKEKPFTLLKFRSMINNAEKNGAVWSSKNDSRITYIGHLLRKSHLDELPQLINILKGELSFVGPRPERPEFTKELEKNIPFYNMRHLLNPGVTGWAQINFRYGSSHNDAREKLEYELYYIKNCSLSFDLSIIIRTIKTIIFTPK